MSDPQKPPGERPKLTDEPRILRFLRGEQVPTDWNDPQMRLDWVNEMRVQLDEMHAIAQDMMRPVRQREFGLRQHRRQFEDAYRSAMGGMDHIESVLLPEREHADPEGAEPKT